jgi:tryptophanyl-tRNA synthetase
MKYNILTGVRATGYMHLGNYVGAIKPLIETAQQIPHSTPLLFIADYHALTDLKDPVLLYAYRRHIAAALLSMDVPNALVFMQSDIAELTELHWIFSSYISLGHIQRCHIYKASTEKNHMNLALFSYPVLMSADILGLEADMVTIGQDQAQHLEIACYIAKIMDLKTPTAKIQQVHNLVGTDGRKMSKSYSNTLPIFARPDEIYNTIMKIPTSSRGIDEPKDSSVCTIFALYSAISSLEQIQEFQVDYDQGISWKEAKEKLYQMVMKEFTGVRERYMYYESNPTLLNNKLAYSAQLIREHTRLMLKQVKQKMGII